MEYQQRNPSVQVQAVETDEGLRAYLLQIYNYMASGLALTGIVAWFAPHSPAVMGMLYRVNDMGQIAGMTGLGWLVAFAPLGFALFLGMRLHHMTFAAAQGAFWAFASVMGLSLASIFITFTGESIVRVFFVTAITFGSMSLYGYATKRDLSGFGSFLIMGAWGLVIGFIVNIFLQSSALHYAMSAIGVLVFTGLTAYDTQRIKSLYYSLANSGEALGKSAIMGALQLYLDFINLFMMLLQFMGDRR